MKVLILALTAVLSFAAAGEEIIDNMLSTKKGQASVRILRDTIVSKNGVPCTVKVLVTNVRDLTSLASTDVQGTIEVGMLRYCGEIKGLDIQSFLTNFSASDTITGTSESQLFERIYVMPENAGGPGHVCERQLDETLEVKLPSGAILNGPGNGFNFPGAPSMEACRGLRQ